MSQRVNTVEVEVREKSSTAGSQAFQAEVVPEVLRGTAESKKAKLRLLSITASIDLEEKMIREICMVKPVKGFSNLIAVRYFVRFAIARLFFRR